MKQSIRALILIYLYVALVVIILTSCRTRQVSADVSKSSDKSKTEQKSEVKEDTRVKVEDKSKITETKSDSSKTLIQEQTEITADEIVQDKDGNIVFKGNAKLKTNKQTNVSNKKDSRLETLKNVQTDLKHSKDSSGSKKQALNQRSVEKKKDTSVESISLMTILVPVGILLLLAFIAIRWNALTRFFKRG